MTHNDRSGSREAICVTGGACNLLARGTTALSLAIHAVVNPEQSLMDDREIRIWASVAAVTGCEAASGPLRGGGPVGELSVGRVRGYVDA